MDFLRKEQWEGNEISNKTQQCEEEGEGRRSLFMNQHDDDDQQSRSSFAYLSEDGG